MKIGVVLLGSTGLIAGVVTLNPIVLWVVTGSCLILGVVTEFKKCKRKIEMTWMAWTTYDK